MRASCLTMIVKKGLSQQVTMGQLYKETLTKKFRETDFQTKRKANAKAGKEQASSVQETERKPV